MEVVIGACQGCDSQVICLAWKDGRRVLVIRCSKCQENRHFDLEEMVRALGMDDSLPANYKVH